MVFSSSILGSRGSPARRVSTSVHNAGGHSNSSGGGGPRDRVSRFFVFSVLLVAYSGVTLGLILWNSSGGTAASTTASEPYPVEGGGVGGVGRGTSVQVLRGGSPDRPSKGDPVAEEGSGAARGATSTMPRPAESDGGLGGGGRGTTQDVSAAVEDYRERDGGGAGKLGAQRGDGLALEEPNGQDAANVTNVAPNALPPPLSRPKGGDGWERSPAFEEPFDVTLVSQTSQNRFWMLPFLCKRWPGPISIAILEEDREALPLELCSRMLISATAAQTPEELDPTWYPVNRLRNVAVRAVRTSHFLMTDIDIWPDANAYQALHMRYRLETEKMEDARNAIVFSAFSRRRFCEEKDCLQYANDVPETIQELKPCLETNTCGRFDAANQSGQGTAYVYYWRSMLRQPNQRSLEHILCFKSHRFEPYLVVRKSALLPMFDERFVGYGKNKIQWINHLRYSGFSFYVMPVNFVIHAPHPKSMAKTTWEKTGGGKQGKGNKLMDQIFETFMGELRAEKGPEENTVTTLCKKDQSPKNVSQFKKKDAKT
eukprot:g4868.t1